VELAQVPQHGGDSHLDPDAITAADLSRPILLAEISPGLSNVIDGNHRLALNFQDVIPQVSQFAQITRVRHQTLLRMSAAATRNLATYAHCGGGGSLGAVRHF
jgi:hypothetical protein